MSIQKLFSLALLGLFLFCAGCSEEAALTGPGTDAANGPTLVDNDVTTGQIDLEVPAGAAIKQVLTYYDISGTVFVDTDPDGVQGPLELGIGNVVLDVTDSQGNVSTVQTDAEGKYLFTRAIGDYTISINLNDHFEFFNDDLDASFTPTTALSIPVSFAASVVNFGFVPDSEAILTDLDFGTLDSDGKTVEYWTKVFRRALIEEGSNRRGHNGDSAQGSGWGHDEDYFGADELRALLATVSGLYLPEPYQFTSGSELEDVYTLLRTRPRTDDEELLRELLVTELNFVSGLGLVDEQDRVGVLISWGEGLLGTAPGAKSADKDRGSDVFNAIQIFSAINTGGGGGVDE